MRYLLVALSLLLEAAMPARAQVSLDIHLPGIDLGINAATYPQLVLIPGYPVYYDPRAASNYFFYDGLYWVYQADTWYASTWYNGPWDAVRPADVPLYLLRVPVRYYRQPPSYFHGWSADAPPHWGEHWGNDWEKSRSGWDQWDHRSVPRAAPLPTYQRQYSGNRYPRAAQQQVAIRAQNYKYQPREAVTRQHFQQPAAAPAHQAPAQHRPATPPPRSKPSAPPQHPPAAAPPSSRWPARDHWAQRFPRSHPRVPHPPPHARCPPHGTPPLRPLPTHRGRAHRSRAPAPATPAHQATPAPHAPADPGTAAAAG